eukprot:2672792-Karenia_brevis.AAC.1
MHEADDRKKSSSHLRTNGESRNLQQNCNSKWSACPPTNDSIRAQETPHKGGRNSPTLRPGIRLNRTVKEHGGEWTGDPATLPPNGWQTGDPTASQRELRT